MLPGGDEGQGHGTQEAEGGGRGLPRDAEKTLGRRRERKTKTDICKGDCKVQTKGNWTFVLNCLELMHWNINIFCCVKKPFKSVILPK